MENENKYSNSFSGSGPEKSKDAGKNVLIVLLLISVALNIFQFFDRKETTGIYEANIDSLSVLQDSVEAELAQTSQELESYRGRSAELDSLLNQAQLDLEAKEKRIKDLAGSEKNTASLNKKLAAELAELKKLRNEYLERIDELIMENRRLKAENDSLNTELAANVSITNNLASRLKVAEQLHADQVVVKSFKKRAIGGKLVETSIARKTVRLETCFRVLENAVAAKGERQISLRIIAPNGQTLAGINNGTFTAAKNNEDLTATSIYNLDYTGSPDNVCLLWEDEKGNLEAGDYEIEIYIDGVAVFAGAYSLQ
jgi:hypothetical protein